MFGWFKIDRISNSFCVSSLDCFRRLMNLTATSFPLRISWQRRTTENRPRPSSSSSMYRRSKSRCQHASRLEVEFCCNTLSVFRCGQISEAENKILGGSITTRLVTSETGFDSTEKEMCYLFVAKLLNPNGPDWGPAVFHLVHLFARGSFEANFTFAFN